MKIHCKKILSLLLAICMLLTLSPVTPVTAEETATATNETTLSATEEITETDALADVPAIDLTADCAILNYVDEEVFEAGNHVLRLHDEETLSSYVFLNADGTKTVYYLDEAVKFVDSEGMIQEKDVTLALSGTAYTTTRNDISLSIPTNPTSGITLIWNGHAVRILPQGGTLSDTVLDGNSIRYTDYYGEGADLVYTPTLTGVKEDIVLESYTGQNVFTFMLNTGGLNLYSTNGRYYLAESKTATDRIELGDLVTFDANGRFSVGTMTSQTVSAGNIYRLTLTVDEEFLTSPDTVYPVSIDPTINVKDADDDTEGSIEDVNIYEGRPNLNADWTYMHVGYYDDTYQTGRILVRLTGFINDDRYDGLSPSQITSATFHLKEATGKAAATINLHAAAGSMTWTESGATWNNCGVTQNTLIDSVEHGRSVVASYNITNLVRAWVSTATSPLRGFILSHAEEDTATKGFYSSEYSNAEYRPYAAITYEENNATVYFDSDQYDVDEDISLQLNAITSPSGQTVTWTSSNPVVATVSSTGEVEGLQAGSTTITATLGNGASASCTVYVTVANGVYYIKNNYSGLYMSVLNTSFNNGTGVVQKGKVTANPARLSQLWKVRYLSDGVYSIRPMHKLDMGLQHSGGNIRMYHIGTTETSISNVMLSARWTIFYDSDGYVFQNAGYSDRTIRPKDSSAAVNKSIIGDTYNSTDSAYRWSVEVPTSTINYQVVLCDTRSGIITNTATRYITPGDSFTQSSLGLCASFVGTGTNIQSIAWSSSNPNAVSVDASTGRITGGTPGSTATIYAKRVYGGITYSASYTVHVAEVPDGTYLIRNREWGTVLQLDDGASADYSVSGTTVETWPYSPDSPQQWTFTLQTDGYYKIISEESGLALSVQSGYWNNSNYSMVQYPYTGSTSQHWQIAKSDNGTYIVRPKSATYYTSDWCMAVGNSSNDDGYTVVQQAYSDDLTFADEWYFIPPDDVDLDIGMSSDDYDNCSCADRLAYRYSNIFLDILWYGLGDEHIGITQHYNKGLIKTAAKNDFAVNGAISNDIDFMVYIGHGHIANDSSGNHLHYSCSPDGVALGNNGDCENDDYNAYSSDMRFGSEDSDLRWVWMYTCNFLTTGNYVSQDSLKNMMGGAHIVMGYASKATLCDAMAEKFAEYLGDGMPIYDAYFLAGSMGEASIAPENHLQRILYIPQARYETIYSPYVDYEYDVSDVIIRTHDIQDEYSFT